MISVIIPTYNRASFLRESIMSILNQKAFLPAEASDAFELIVIDDGSTDDTKETVAGFGKRIRYTYQPHQGVSAARNLGLRLAGGDFIAFLDSDDLWDEDKISIQMSYMNAFPRASVCYTEETWVRRGVVVNPKKKHRKYSGWIFDKVLALCLISLSSALFRREVFDQIGMFDERLPACEDYDFGIRLAHRYPVFLLSRPLIIKRGGHADQLSRKYWGMDRFRIEALEKALGLDLTQEQERLVKKELVRKARIVADGFRKRRKRDEAQKYTALIEKYEDELKEVG